MAHCLPFSITHLPYLNQRLMRLCRIILSCRSAGLITSGDTPGRTSIHSQNKYRNVCGRRKLPRRRVQEGATMSLTELKNMSMSVLMELAEKYLRSKTPVPCGSRNSSLRCCRLVRPGAVPFTATGCWKSCLTATVFCVPHCRAICPARTIFMFPPLRFGAFICARVMWFPGQDTASQGRGTLFRLAQGEGNRF